jgi:CRISPR-associated protein Cmr3
MVSWIVEPRHGFFAKDARGWFAGSGLLANCLPWILPTTMRGALCTAIGRELELSSGKLFAPQEWLDLKDKLQLIKMIALRAPVGQPFTLADRMWPAPADAVLLEDHNHPIRLTASKPTVRFWDRKDDATLAALEIMTVPAGLTNADAKPLTGPAWWTEEEFIGWLTGNASRGPSSKIARFRHPALRSSVHVKMDNTTETADTGLLWSQEFRETITPRSSEGTLVDRWGIAVSLMIEAPSAQRVVPTVTTLAGDRHLASIHCGQSLDTIPETITEALNVQSIHRIRLYAITPTYFVNGWYPDGFSMDADSLVGRLPGISEPVRLVSACVGRPTPISGWDRARQNVSGGTKHLDSDGGGMPRATRLCCPPGSVWVFERCDQRPFDPSYLASLWLKQWGLDAADGLGLFVAGVDSASENKT